MNLTHLELLIMILDATLATAALVALLLRGLQSKWPLLISFLAIRAASGLAQIHTAYGPYHNYFYTYWLTTGLQFLCQFGILYEVCRNVLSSSPAVPKGFPKIIAICVASAAVLSILIAVKTHGSFSAKMVAIAVGMQRTATMAWCASFVVCAASTSWLGLGWKRDTLIIGAGSAARNASGMVAAFLFGLLSIKQSTIVDHVSNLIDLSVLLLWFVSLKPAKDIQTNKLPDLESIESLKAIAHSTLGVPNT